MLNRPNDSRLIGTRSKSHIPGTVQDVPWVETDYTPMHLLCEAVMCISGKRCASVRNSGEGGIKMKPACCMGLHTGSPVGRGSLDRKDGQIERLQLAQQANQFGLIRQLSLQESRPIVLFADHQTGEPVSPAVRQLPVDADLIAGEVIHHGPNSSAAGADAQTRIEPRPNRDNRLP